MNTLNYLIQTNLYLLLFIGFYAIVLKNETFFRLNRIFLNASVLISFLIPFMNSEWFRQLFITQQVRETAILPSQVMYDTIVVGVDQSATSLTIADFLLGVYIIGASIIFIRFIANLLSIRYNRYNCNGRAFSFFKILVVDPQLGRSETIINHEKVHIRQWHSADIIFMELASVINWFNPAMYLFKNEIRQIHEFIADEEAANLLQSKSDYALLLFNNTLGVNPLPLSNNFFNQSILKKRIMMLHKNRSQTAGLWKYGFSAPLFMLMLILSAAAASADSNALSVDNEKSIPAVERITSISLQDALAGPTTSAPARTIEQNTKVSISSSPESLKRHISQKIAYTSSAREAGALGYLQVNFNVIAKKISGVRITKSLHSDLDQNVLAAFASFNSEIPIADGEYFITVTYIDGTKPAKSQNIERIPKELLSAKNYLGQVVAMVETNNTVKAGWTPGVGRESGVSGELNPMGSNSKAGQTGSDQAIKDFSAVDILPEFPGGMKGWGAYLNSNLKYPQQARENKLTGRVIISFIVEKDGKLSNIKVLRGIGGGADEEAVRVLQGSPNWKPGLMEGKPVRVAYTMPIFFQLPGSSNPPSSSQQTSVSPPALPADVMELGKVDVLPQFPGAMQGWAKYVQDNLKYPELAKTNKVNGRIIVSFIAEKDGKLSNIKVLRGLGSGLDEEAVRVLQNSPAWTPGMHQGKPVRVAYTMPIFIKADASN